MKLLKDSKLKEFTIIDNNLFYEKDLSTYEKIVYIVLVKNSNHESCCFLSYKILSDEAGCSAKRVSRALNKLEDKKMVKREKMANCNSNMYILLEPIWLKEEGKLK